MMVDSWRCQLALFPLAAIPSRASGWDWGTSSFVWPDVALVYILSALPLAAVIALSIRRLFAGPTRMPVVQGTGSPLPATSARGELAAPPVAPFGDAAPLSGRLHEALTDCLGLIGLVIWIVILAAVAHWGGSPFIAAAWRGLVALGTALGFLLIAASVFPPFRRKPAPHGSLLGLGVVAAIALAVLPEIYIQARCRHDKNEFANLMEQTRLGEAQSLLRGLLLLQPEAEWENGKLGLVAAELEQSLWELEQRIANPMSPQATEARWMERARNLAILGRTDEAIEALLGMQTSPPAAETCNLLGTIYETRLEWAPARRWYAQAREEWQAASPGPERTSGWMRATLGVAHSCRKLGQLREAESAYLALLEAAPTAESHFLLAQFYEDTQQATVARHHARQAMALDPTRYAQSGRKLINKLVTLHFGCLNVFDAEQNPEPAAGRLHSY